MLSLLPLQFHTMHRPSPKQWLARHKLAVAQRALAETANLALLTCARTVVRTCHLASLHVCCTTMLLCTCISVRMYYCAANELPCGYQYPPHILTGLSSMLAIVIENLLHLAAHIGLHFDIGISFTRRKKI